MSGVLDPAVDEALKDPNNLSRPKFFIGAISQFSASPLIGAGLGAFASTGLDLYPHNMIAEIAAELGLLGLIALGTWILLVVRASIRSAVLTALIVATLVFSVFSGNIAGEAEFWFFSALAVGLVPVAGRAIGPPESKQTPFERSLKRV
jgi:O-antigen ligase